MANVLIVDDSFFMRKLLMDILIKDGHIIVGQAGNAHEAYALYQELRPDVVTMDIVMPIIENMTTLNAVEKIIEFDPNAKILMITTMGQEEVIADFFKAGANDFLLKPFQASNVLSALQKLRG
jgi:two-component system chemotaxis response regulator CheY